MEKLEFLIVDDSESLRQLLQKMLEAFYANFTHAADGLEANKLISQIQYDLIFMDIEMPGKSGLDVIKRVRNVLGYRYTPIIVMTGLQRTDLIKQAFDAGASDYIAKPLHEMEVLARSKMRLDNRRLSRELAFASQSKSEFISRLAHELRDPLNASSGMAQFIKMRTSDEKILHACDSIIDASAYQEGLVNEATDLVKIEAGVIKVHDKLIMLDNFLEELHAFANSMIGIRDVNLTMPETADYAYKVRVDPKRLKEILINLLSNAIKYNKPNGTIDLTLEIMPDNHLVFAVKDTGIGIAEDALPNLYQPFTRLGAEKTKIKGVGNGLLLTKKLTELLGGELTAESQLGIGTRFIVDMKKTRVIKT